MAEPKERRATPRKPGSKAAPKPSGKPPPRTGVPDDELKRLIAEAAYFRAKARGFTPGYELEDWVQAEVEVRRRIGNAA